jgi:cellulose synthase/poly-beta-1,6-N-acetylglucosamine synthase-like glycosyltransferase
MHILYWISLGFILAGLILIIYIIIKDFKPETQKLKTRSAGKYAIIIPARNESAVIEQLLDSLSVQTDLKDTYIIVEKSTDKTCKIAEKYGANVFVRKVTKETKRKGYALDECFKYLLKKRKKYDLYFIFDADNVVAPNYIKEMLKTYEEGYLIGAGYRNIKNNDNVFATCSGLTFSIINSFFNERRNYNKKSIVIMGTGFYIDASLIKKWGGFPFHSLTEDYELTLYCSEHNINSHYNKNAVFYDEQPTTMASSITQRTRWIKGFLECRKKGIKKIKTDHSRIWGILPYLLMIIGFACYLFTSLMISLYYIIRGNLLFRRYLIYFFITILIIYMILFAITYLIIIKEIERLNMPASNTLKALFFHPIFLFTYLICLFKAVKNDKLEWEVIDHNKTMS